jgi:hypothetical protein
MKFAIANGYIVTAREDGAIGLNALVVAKLDTSAGSEKLAALMVEQANEGDDIVTALAALLDKRLEKRNAKT